MRNVVGGLDSGLAVVTEVATELLTIVVTEVGKSFDGLPASAFLAFLDEASAPASISPSSTLLRVVSEMVEVARKRLLAASPL